MSRTYRPINACCIIRVVEHTFREGGRPDVCVCIIRVKISLCAGNGSTTAGMSRLLKSSWLPDGHNICVTCMPPYPTHQSSSLFELELEASRRETEGSDIKNAHDLRALVPSSFLAPSPSPSTPPLTALAREILLARKNFRHVTRS